MSNASALIGYSGFVGSNLMAKREFSETYRSSNIESIQGMAFESVVCAGIQAMKWWANLHPAEDKAGIDRLLLALSKVEAERFTLISTIDVYPVPQNVDENTVIGTEGHHAYGLHRLEVEEWVRDHFRNVLIVRLPGLFGPGLKKNVIFDLLNDNNLESVHDRGVFQYYDLRRLADDLDKAWGHGLSLLNLSTAPISTSDIRERFFPGKMVGGSGPAPNGYDMKSCHAEEWGGTDGYLYPAEQVWSDLGDWLQTQVR